MNIAFIGQVSAGKSAIINSLFGKRICETGTARTTLDLKKYNYYNLVLYDFPGISDTFNASFDNLCKEFVIECDLH